MARGQPHGHTPALPRLYAAASLPRTVRTPGGHAWPSDPLQRAPSRAPFSNGSAHSGLPHLCFAARDPDALLLPCANEFRLSPKVCLLHSDLSQPGLCQIVSLTAALGLPRSSSAGSWPTSVHPRLSRQRLLPSKLRGHLGRPFRSPSWARRALAHASTHWDAGRALTPTPVPSGHFRLPRAHSRGTGARTEPHGTGESLRAKTLPLESQHRQLSQQAGLNEAIVSDQMRGSRSRLGGSTEAARISRWGRSGSGWSYTWGPRGRSAVTAVGPHHPQVSASPSGLGATVEPCCAPRNPSPPGQAVFISGSRKPTQLPQATRRMYTQRGA